MLLSLKSPENRELADRVSSSTDTVFSSILLQPEFLDSAGNSIGLRVEHSLFYPNQNSDGKKIGKKIGKKQHIMQKYQQTV